MNLYVKNNKGKFTKIHLNNKNLFLYFKYKNKLYKYNVYDIIKKNKLKKFNLNDRKQVIFNVFKEKFLKVKKETKKIKKISQKFLEKNYYYEINPNKEGEYLYYKLLDSDISIFDNPNKFKKLLIIIKIKAYSGIPREIEHRYIIKLNLWKDFFNQKPYWLIPYQDLVKFIVNIVKIKLKEQNFSISGKLYQKKRIPVRFNISINVKGYYGKYNFKKSIKKIFDKIKKFKLQRKKDTLKIISMLSEKLLYEKLSPSVRKRIEKRLKKLNKKVKEL